MISHVYWYVFMIMIEYKLLTEVLDVVVHVFQTYSLCIYEIMIQDFIRLQVPIYQVYS